MSIKPLKVVTEMQLLLVDKLPSVGSDFSGVDHLLKSCAEKLTVKEESEATMRLSVLYTYFREYGKVPYDRLKAAVFFDLPVVLQAYDLEKKEKFKAGLEQIQGYWPDLDLSDGFVTALPLQGKNLPPTRPFDDNFFVDLLEMVPRTVLDCPADSPIFLRSWVANLWSSYFGKARMIGDSYQRKNAWLHSLRTLVMLATLGTCRRSHYKLENGEEIKIDHSLLKNTCYSDSEVIPPLSLFTPYKETIVEVVNEDCCEVARACIREGLHPVMLNMANASRPGGGYKKGDGAQEENIFRRSNYYKALDNIDESEENRESIYPISLFGGIYTSNVTIFRGTEDKGYPYLEEPYQVDCLAVAAKRLKERPVDDILSPKDELLMRKKIITIFSIALNQGRDALVLSAFGCGAFHNPPSHVSRIFLSVLQEFSTFFKVVRFAVVDDHNSNGNYASFHANLHNAKLIPKPFINFPISLGIPYCPHGVGCEKTSKKGHMEQYWHPPYCPHIQEGSICPERDAIHRRMFYHPEGSLSNEQEESVLQYCQDGPICYTKFHDLEDEHWKLFRHVCRFGVGCNKQDETHRHYWEHPNRPPCLEHPKCKLLADVEHRQQFHHPDFPDLLIPCRDGAECDKKQSEKHYKTYGHPKSESKSHSVSFYEKYFG